MLTPDERLQIISLYKEKVSVIDIAKKFSITRQSVYQILNKVPSIPRQHPIKSIGYAIKRGDIIPQPCEICGLPPNSTNKGGYRRVHAHHDNYSKPLAVRWLCSKHHVAFHKIQIKEGNKYRHLSDLSYDEWLALEKKRLKLTELPVYNKLHRFCYENFESIIEGCEWIANEINTSTSVVANITYGGHKPSLILCNKILAATLGAIGVSELRPDIYESLLNGNRLSDEIETINRPPFKDHEITNSALARLNADKIKSKNYPLVSECDCENKGLDRKYGAKKRIYKPHKGVHKCEGCGKLKDFL